MDDRLLRMIEVLSSSFWPLLKAGLAFTVPLAIISFILGIIFAFFIALARLSKLTWLSRIASGYVWLIRGTPLLVQLFILFYGLPSIGLTLDAFVSAIIGFTMSVGAYSSETIRAAILAVPKGQWEAAQVLGMSKSQTLMKIILPQALRIALPPLANAFISLVKDTSLAAAITYTEMFQVAQQITARTYEPLWLYMEAALIYLMFCTVLSILQDQLEKNYRKSGDIQ